MILVLVLFIIFFLLILKYNKKIFQRTYVQKPSNKLNSNAKGEWKWEMLKKTSRSFSIVIQELDKEIREVVCIFYLVLRALDTVEDDMETIKDLEYKLDLLRRFHTLFSMQNDHKEQEEVVDDQDDGWYLKIDPIPVKGLFDIQRCGTNENERKLVTEIKYLVEDFNKLSPKYQRVIIKICAEMGKGMSENVLKGEVNIQNTKELDKYCYYVAGIVGVGLTELFVLSGLQPKSLFDSMKKQSISMGLFLQKTNIIRDIYEDVPENRIFWPSEIWGKYTDSPQELVKLSQSSYKLHKDKSLSCLNEMVTNTLQHIPDVLDYLKVIENNSIFKFCAIPQVMAIATLNEVTNNSKVFIQNVKIRRDLTLKIFHTTKNFEKTHSYFEHYREKLMKKIDLESFKSTKKQNEIFVNSPNRTEKKIF
ncbi:squalene synthase [Anaeramoeba flamelloides]|uniref:Squalene synthase n=1 Tax=Anaeramoeba flamelloides TaxID=1746091 RepID=A0AAV7YTJ1_9EUKA|nr:squalene synthase [Anaeramoeba flamelloides]